jgi:cell division protein FtsN
MMPVSSSRTIRPSPRHGSGRAPSQLPRQRGNTLTGIIIGLIVGLAIAVAVALAITKGATPFSDKSSKPGKMAEPTVGQAADPNKPLYSNKEAAREANKRLSEKPAVETRDPAAHPVVAAAEPAAAATPTAPAAPRADAKTEPKAATEAPKSAPVKLADASPAAATAAGGDDKYTYYLQAGAFREVSDAENTRAKLLLLGFDVSLSERASDSGVLHRVRIGPFGQVESMNKARARLLENGIDVAIVRNQK